MVKLVRPVIEQPNNEQLTFKTCTRSSLMAWQRALFYDVGKLTFTFYEFVNWYFVATRLELQLLNRKASLINSTKQQSDNSDKNRNPHVEYRIVC